jgi:hypothetical protein
MKPLPGVSIVAYTGIEPAAARAAAAEASLDATTTTLLVDFDSRVARGLYAAEPCPRAFVIDAAGKLVFTNPEPAGAPRSTPAEIAARTLAALRAAPAADSRRVPPGRLAAPPRSRGKGSQRRSARLEGARARGSSEGMNRKASRRRHGNDSPAGGRR